MRALAALAAAGVLAAAVVALAGGLGRDSGDGRSGGVPGYRMTVPKAGATVRHPEGWDVVPRAELPAGSPGLVWVARGPQRSAGSACPQPLMLLRASATTGGTLDAAVVLYNRFATARHRGRRVVSQRAVRVPGASRAVLIVADHPARPPQPGRRGSGRRVRTFDLLLEPRSGGAQHLFAHGCRGDLPRRFLESAVLSLRTS